MDISWLWEEYVATVLNEHFFHSNNKKRTGSHYLFTGNTGRVYPDFLGFTRAQNIVIDAKYKNDFGIHGSDYHQILSYMYRFERKIGMFVHPSNQNSVRKYNLLSGADQFTKAVYREDSIYKYSFYIDVMSENYPDFVKKISSEEKKTLYFLEKLF